MGTVRVGTSAWANPTLIRDSNFYPPTVHTPADRLRYYATQFTLVEADSTYYRVASEQMVLAWNDRTPDGFVVNVKAFRAFTLHPTPSAALPADLRSDLSETAARKRNLYWQDLSTELQRELWARFRLALERLAQAQKLGAVLFQFPAWIHPTHDNQRHLEALRRALPDFHLAVEFRDISWVSSNNLKQTLKLLSRHDLTFVCVDEPRTARLLPPLIRVTTPGLAVTRLHGRNTEAWKTRGETTSERSRYLYNEHELGEWVPRIEELARTASEVHVVFNNSYADYAVKNAHQFVDLLLDAGIAVRQPSNQEVVLTHLQRQPYVARRRLADNDDY